MINLIYIGDEFYEKSNTMMSPLYTTTGQRSDWGHVKELLRRGEHIDIRPATEKEIEQYEVKLAKLILADRVVK